MIKDSSNPDSNIKDKLEQFKYTQGSMMKSFKDDTKMIKKKHIANNVVDYSFNHKGNFSNSSFLSMINSMNIKEHKKKKPSPNLTLEASFNNINHIINNDELNLSDIDNSILNECDQWDIHPHPQSNYIKSSIPPIVNIQQEDHIAQLSSYYKEKISNAYLNEEIILPDVTLIIDKIEIRTPIKIKGQIKSCLEIALGPILINISHNAKNDSVKISQLKICYTNEEIMNQNSKEIKNNDDNDNNNLKQSLSCFPNLFKLYPASLLELEDCEVVYQGKKINQHISNGLRMKSIAFSLNHCHKLDRNRNEDMTMTTVLTLTNTSVLNFYQTVRADKNCIVNLNKSFITKNYGRSIVMLNPLILKINETTFERNANNAVHIKFLKEDNFNEKRLFDFSKNTFEMNLGNAITIEGCKEFKNGISMTITENKFIENQSDGVIISDMICDQCAVLRNTFDKNKGNGLNFQKLLLTTDVCGKIQINHNHFTENTGFGLFVNDTQIDASNNNFTSNKASGMILCKLVLQRKIGSEMKKSDHHTSSLSTNEDKSYSSIEKKTSKLSNNTFFQNGQNGLEIINYHNTVTLEENVFKKNCDHGLFIDLDTISTFNTIKNGLISQLFLEKIKQFKNGDDSLITEMTNVFIYKCFIEKNVKSGLSMNYCFISCEESSIVDNIGHAISTAIKDFQFCFNDIRNKKSKNTLAGKLGGEWGEVNINTKFQCSINCFNGFNTKRIKNNNNDDG